MAIDDAPLNDLPLTSPIDTASVDPLGILMATPMRKLDADEYTANDLDGVTESATGSGNLNFLMMQAAQTNESIGTLNPFDAQGNKGPNSASFAGAVTYADGDEVYTTSMDRPAEYEAPADTQTLFDGGGNSVLATSNFNGGGGNPFADSTPSSDASAVTPASPTSGTNGVNGLNGNNGFSGIDGHDGNGGGGDGDIIIINNNNNQTTVINNNTTVYEGSTTNIYDTVNTVTNNVTNIVDSTTTNIFDTVNNVTNNLTTILDGTTTNLFDTINNVTNNVFDTVNNLTTTLTDTVTNLFDTVNHITTNLTEILNNTVNNITDILTNITDILGGGGDGNGGLLGGLGPIGLNLDATLDGVTNLSLDILNGDTITNLLNETLGTAPILTPVTDILGELMSSTSLDILLNPFQPDNSAGDVDLHLGADINLLGLQIPTIALDIPLDPIEALLGDIDLSLDLNNTLLDGLLGGGIGDGGIPIVSDLLGGLPGGIGGGDGGIPVVSDLLGGLLGGGSGNGDTDLALGGLGGLLDAGVINGVAQTIVNPVEDLLGDIDIGGTIGLGLLGLESGQTGADTDITIPLDIALIDSPLPLHDLNISLDPIESLVGDIDLDLGVAANLLGDVAGNLFDTAAGGTGTDGLLPSVGNVLTDVAGGILDSGVGDLLGGLFDVLEFTMDNAISIVDSAPTNTGGLDLGALTGGLTNGLTDVVGGDAGSWTETILPNAGDLLGGGIGGVLGGITDGSLFSSMPDVGAGAPALSLPAIPVLPSIPVLGGGLFGGGHGGGLFG